MRSDEVTGILSEMQKARRACESIKELNLNSGIELVELVGNPHDMSGTGPKISVLLTKSQAKIMARTVFNASARRFNQLAASINCEDRIEILQGKEATGEPGDDTE